MPETNRHLMAQCLSVGPPRYVGDRNKCDLEKTTKLTSADDIRISGFVRLSDLVLVISHNLLTARPGSCDFGRAWQEIR